jgi:hypothetical protein
MRGLHRSERVIGNSMRENPPRLYLSARLRESGLLLHEFCDFNVSVILPRLLGRA